MSTKQVLAVALGIVALIAAIILPFQMFETVEADEIVVKQGALDGSLTVWSDPGLKPQMFGKLTRYKKSGQFWFLSAADKKKQGWKDENDMGDESIRVRFNDGGNGTVSGSLSYDLPKDEKSMKRLHSTYGSQDAIADRLIQQGVTKAVYMTGPLMSSKESSGERRADLINYVADQTSRGVYKTEAVEDDVPDLLAGEIEVVEVQEVPVLDDDKKPMLDKNGKPVMKKEPHSVKKPRTKKVIVVQPKLGPDKQIEVQEKSALADFNIHTYNLSITSIIYDDAVEKQIEAQQQATMAIQTQMAKAKEADQVRLTVEKQGEASAAKAKWDQEVKKAQAITEAEQRKAVAALALDSAKLERDATIEKARGESEARELILKADGALDKKLAAWVEVQKSYAAEIGKQRWVPDVQFGGDAKGGNAATSLMELLSVKAARDLQLDMEIKK